MLKALNTAATGMVAQQNRIHVISNNMANVNTTGFRRARAEFQDLLYQTLKTPGGQTAEGATLPSGLQYGQGTRTVATVHIHQQGSMKQTENPLDIAIEGDGFLQIRRPNGDIAYSRAGNFKADPDGRLITADGFVLEPDITVPPDASGITVAPDGMVSVVTPGQQAAQQVGQIELARFINPAGLRAVGHSLFMPTSASGEPMVAIPGQDGTGTLAQGFLEGSNVEVVNEMIDLITSQRAYDINQKVIEASDEMLRRTTQR
ncbi:MAG: flagellar basal-body rod protein FlgG [Polyangiales bacterium]